MLKDVYIPGASESTPSRSSAKAVPEPSSLSRGTRATRRTRQVEEEWQPIPDEWLHPEGQAVQAETAGAEVQNGEPSKAVESELSSLTDEVEGDQLDSAKTRNGEEEGEKAEAEDDVVDKVDETEVKNGEDEEKPAEPEDTTMDVDLIEEEKDVADIEMKDDWSEEKPVEEPKAEVEKEETDEVKLAMKEVANIPEGFVEWEAVSWSRFD